MNSEVPSDVPRQPYPDSRRANLYVVTGPAPENEPFPAEALSDDANSTFVDLLILVGTRSSGLIAQCGVLVLALTIVDVFLGSGHLATGSVVGAVSVGLLLLGASIAIDFVAKRLLRIS